MGSWMWIRGRIWIGCEGCLGEPQEAWHEYFPGGVGRYGGWRECRYGVVAGDLSGWAGIGCSAGVVSTIARRYAGATGALAIYWARAGNSLAGYIDEDISVAGLLRVI